MSLDLARRHHKPRKSIEDFPDDIITRTVGDRHAILDVGFFERAADPDFAPAGRLGIRAESIASCAARIRRTADPENGEQTSCLRGYDLLYRLMPHWERKQRLAEAGVDPNEAISGILRMEELPDWEVRSEHWIDGRNTCRHMEFFFRLVSAVQASRISDGLVPEADAVEEGIEELRKELEDTAGARMGPGLEERLRNRLLSSLRPGEAVREEPSPAL